MKSVVENICTPAHSLQCGQQLAPYAVVTLSSLTEIHSALGKCLAFLCPETTTKL